MSPSAGRVVRDAVAAIRPPDEAAADAARRRLDSLTKPPGSLGRLEELAVRLAAIQGGAPHVDRKALAIFAGDHGVAARGVSAYPREVTRQMVLNFAADGAAANVLARQARASVTVVDVGVDGDVPAGLGVVDAKVRLGTRDLVSEDAMTADECARAMEVGLAQAGALAGSGVDCLLAGEMGIGNTTPAAAVFCALLGIAPADAAGRGTGVGDEGLRRKVDALGSALARHGARRDPLDVLASLGGLEIAAIAGFAIGAADARVPLVVDGFIATAGVAVALALAPPVRPFLFFAHRSSERAHGLVLERLGARPLLDLEMRLGEGTGALVAAHLLDAACRISAEMATFASAGVSGAADAARPEMS